MARWCYLLLLLISVLPSWGVVLRSGQNLVIGQDQLITDDLVVSGGTVQVLGRVTGDLLIAGGNVTASGPIGGDVIAAGGTANLAGPVGGSVYAAGGTINLKSDVGRNVVVAGGTVIVEPAASIARDLAVSAGNVTVSGRVGGDLRDHSGNLLLTNTARVNGNLIAMTAAPNIAAGAVIGGQRVISQPARERYHRGREFRRRFIWSLFFGMSLLLLGLLFIAIAPRLTEETEVMLKAHPWGSVLAGFLVLLVTPLAILVIALTCLGLPLALVLSSLYLSALMLAPMFVAILIGHWLLRKRPANLYLALLLGVLVLVVVHWIPVVNFLVMLVVLLLGLGALALALQGRTAHPLLPPAPPPATPPAEAA